MKAANPSVAQALVMVDELVRCGVTDAVLAPGSRSAPLAMALQAERRLRLHVRVDERSAAFLALGLARASGRPAALLCTSGTAAANFFPAVLEAHESRVPMLVLTADRPPELRATGANQTTDQIKLYGGTVRWFCEVGVAEDRPGMVAYWRATICRAWAAATGGPAGPVHLNLALREPLVPDGDGFVEALDGRDAGAPWVAVTPEDCAPGLDTLDALAGQVAAAQRGVLVVGDTDTDANELVAFAERAGWPLVAEAVSSARRGSNAISGYHHLLSSPAFAAGYRPDLVIRVGRLSLSRALLQWLDADVPQVLVDADGAWLDPQRTVREVLRADPAAVLGGVADLLAGQQPSDAAQQWLAGWRAHEQRAGQALDGFLAAHEMSEPGVARLVTDALAEGATLVLASSMPVRDVDQTMRPHGPRRVIANRGVSGIDGFVSTAVGVAAHADGPAVALCGDLSLIHDANGLLGADVDLTMVVVNNDGGGIFSFLPQARYPEGFETVFGTPHGADLAALARAYGAGYLLARRPQDVRDAVATPGEGLRLVEVRTDRTENAAVHQALREHVAGGI